GQVCPPKGAMRPVSRNFQARIDCSAPVSPVAEGIEQPLLHPFRQIFLGQLSRGADGGPELTAGLRAARAEYPVLLHLRARALVERSLEDLREELHELAAGQVVGTCGAHHLPPSAAHPASACRTLVRARCRSTR